MVENHRFCIGVRGSREAKELERFLEGLLEEGATEDKVPGTDMILPPVMFNALFLTFHGLKHFLGEGIRLRHICDWACFVAREQQNMDWQTFYAVCDRYHMRRYADVMTAIAVHGLGLRVENPEITVDSRYADRVLSSVLNDNDLINSRGKVNGGSGSNCCPICRVTGGNTGKFIRKVISGRWCSLSPDLFSIEIRKYRSIL